MLSFRNAVALAALSTCIALPAYAQRPTGGGGTGTGGTGTGTGTGTTSVPSSIPSPSRSTQPIPNTQTVYLSGTVLLDTGDAPPEPVSVVRVCNGRTRKETYTSTRGDFSFMIGSQAPTTVLPDASDDDRGFGPDASFGRMGATQGGVNRNIEQMLNGCELKAELPGYSSSVLSLAGHMALDNPNVGTIILHRLSSGGEGNSISVTSLQVPPGARKEFEKAREASLKNKTADAQKHVAKAIELYPKYAAAYLFVGDMQARDGHIEEAEKSYHQAIDADSKYVTPYLRLAFMTAMEKKWQDTVHLTDKIFSLDPSSYPNAYYYNAVAHYNLGQRDEAERSALKVVELDKQHTEPRAEFLLGAIYAGKGEYPKAIEHYNAYLHFFPDGPESEKIRADVATLEQRVASQNSNR